MGKHIFINPKTGRKERHIQCPACCKFIPESEYTEHKCEEQKHNIGIMWM